MTHLPGIPKDAIDKIREALKLPEATFEFRYTFDKLFDPKAGTGVLMQVVTGEILIRLERGPKLNLLFIHSSPSTGTRMASANIDALIGSDAVRLLMMWSPTEIGLQVADANNASRFVRAIGANSDRKFRVGGDGNVYEVGDKGVEVAGLRVTKGGRTVLQPTAIESWSFTVEGVKILFRGSSPDGYIFENVTTNMAIVMLMTGFETYCGRRFLEMENEGIKPNHDALVDEFLSSKERDRGDPAAIVQEAKEKNVSPVMILKQKKIDFGNWDHCKSAYNKGYGVKFGELKVANTVLEELQHLIRYRHRIVHVSPLLGMLNDDRISQGESPVFANRQYGNQAISVTSEFVEALHEATLKLRP
jgi:hypothetical protein